MGGLGGIERKREGRVEDRLVVGMGYVREVEVG